MPTGNDQLIQMKRVDRKIGQARLALGFEHLWAGLHWPLVILAIAAALVIGGVLPQLPIWPRLAVLIFFTIALLWSLWPLRHLRWPSRHEGMRRVEEKTGLTHRPVSAGTDSLANGANGPMQQAIWQEHRLRQLRSLSDLKAGAPASTWRDIDPRALRLPAALALVAAILLGPGDPRGNLVDSFAFSAPAPAPQLAMDAWVRPPAYTAVPPLLLTSPAMAERLKLDPEIHIPEKSVLSLRITGAKAPVLSFHAPVEGTGPSPEVQGFKPKIKSADGVFQAEVTLERPAIIKVTDAEKELGSWRISLIPDAPPKVEISETPTGDSSGMLTAKWKASDDYGVTGITADIYLADTQDDGEGFTDAGIFEFDPPKLPVSLRRANSRDETGESKADVAEHPWAGFMVEMTLTARDAAGNTMQSEKRVFRLPERQFTKPLARALIEQRRRLILDPEEAGGVAEMLDAILTYPEGLIEGSGPHIAIAAALSRLRDTDDRANVDTAIGLLWQIAVNVEDGVLADAKAELEAIRKELEKALRDGAPPERIAQLTEKLRKALDRYMQSMMEDAKKRMSEGQKNQAPQKGMVVTPQDLKKMLDMIDKLSKSGDNEAAQQMLSQLENILRNMKPGMPQQGQQGQEGPLSQMLDKLSDLMRQQQKLMDETQRAPQQGMGEDGQQDGEQNGQQEGQQGMGGLGDRQQGLSQMLEELMKQFGQNGMDAPRSFGQAGKSMNRAEGSLRDGDKDQALGDQGEALAKLREGAQGLARQMMQQSQGQQGNEGRDGEARGDDRDPLGRPLPSTSEDTGPDRNMLPSEQALQRAREILDMLRSRAGDSALPKFERDYIDRLLRGLY
ncbi:TIGR02302 family protein [Aestuariivirga sp.]|uniref:TIGR02302 family protein n=1 Tax=Aestuariivirga sp. TaxID=2650926 RepID=UPI003BAA2DC7